MEKIMFKHAWTKSQAWKGKEINLYTAISEIQGHTAMEIAFGPDLAPLRAPYTFNDGTTKEIDVSEYTC